MVGPVNFRARVSIAIGHYLTLVVDACALPKLPDVAVLWKQPGAEVDHLTVLVEERIVEIPLRRTPHDLAGVVYVRGPVLPFRLGAKGPKVLHATVAVEEGMPRGTAV